MKTLAILVLTSAALVGFGRRDIRADDQGVAAEGGGGGGNQTGQV